MAQDALGADAPVQADSEVFGAPVAIGPSSQWGEYLAANAAATCTTPDAGACPRAPLASTATPGTVFVVPAPTGDPAKDLAVLQAAVKDKQYAVIDGANGAKRQSYAINGMLEIQRSVTIRNLEIKQLDADYVVRTIYASGSGTPITLRLDNIKIERGPANSGATGSVSDSAGIWTTGVTPEFSNIEILGGGKGDGILIVNATGGYLNDVYVHDITWSPYAEDQKDETFWKTFTLATLRKLNNWNGFDIQDYDGRQLKRVRIEEQVNGIVLNNVTGLSVNRARVERLMTKFSDGQLYPYQTDGINIVSGNQIAIRDAVISHVAEGIDVPGFPTRAIEIANAAISDVPLFCFKTRGSYDSSAATVTAASDHVTIKNSAGRRCGMAAFQVAAGADAWLQDTQALDTGMGPNGQDSPGIGTVAAYRFFRSSALPTLDGQSTSIGMHIVNATVANPNSKYMQAVFHSENDPADKRTFAMARNYAVSNPAKPDVKVATNFTLVENAASTAATSTVVQTASTAAAAASATTVAAATSAATKG